MKTLNAIIERSEDCFYAYVKQLDGCVAGGSTYAEVKQNLEEMINIFIAEDPKLKQTFSEGFNLIFEVSLDSVFELLPEINISQLAILGKLNPGLLRQYVSGSKKASEAQAKRVMQAIDKLVNKLNSISLSA
ncbi:type II toxin-antitoxin system HicB family antitoxin [Portibacter marinus]|uniref:type II toxin-antitoxin system HicB family antitoxin n=1 Tax=Portibacter marinus TaxID=2898660 RepID=UPI001F3059B0|nr:type II toxin-antitoxin system HicB family antitoxin [Portibacter marinus]